MKYIFILFVVTATFLNSCSANNPLPEVEVEPDNKVEEKSLRELVDEKFAGDEVYIGAASHFSLFGTKSIEILDREFGYVTPANDFKQSYIHPVPDKYQYEKSDAWVEHCVKNKQLIRMHAPISPQCSHWVRNDSRTAEELDLMLTEYMTTLCVRYNGNQNIRWLDVVNETIDKRTGGWFGPKPGTDKWENPWPKIGFDETHTLNPPVYIKKAFEIANEHAPNLKLIINQHGALEKDTWEKMKALVSYLRENNLRVDGLGWQAHIDLGWEKIPGNIEYLAEIIQWCHSNSLEFHITEFNVWLKNEDKGKLYAQANTFEKITKTVLDNRKTGVVGINFWQIRSEETQNKSWDGCLFDTNYKPKPAYFKIRELLESY